MTGAKVARKASSRRVKVHLGALGVMVRSVVLVPGCTVVSLQITVALMAVLMVLPNGRTYPLLFWCMEV